MIVALLEAGLGHNLDGTVGGNIVHAAGFAENTSEYVEALEKAEVQNPAYELPEYGVVPYLEISSPSPLDRHRLVCVIRDVLLLRSFCVPFFPPQLHVSLVNLLAYSKKSLKKGEISIFLEEKK